MKLLIPLVLALAGLGGGLAAGHFLRPPSLAEGAEPQMAAAAPPTPARAPLTEDLPVYDPTLKLEYVQLDRQFVVPLVGRDVVGALMIVSLSLEVEAGFGEEVHLREPKLRDMFLQVMFRHAQSGAFDGPFTSGPAMHDLRGSLLEAAQSVMGPLVRTVLVTDIVRQDL